MKTTDFDRSLPIKIRKQLSIPLPYLAGTAIGWALLQILPALLSGASLTASVLHSGGVAPGGVAIIVAVYFLTRDTGELEITEAGVRVETKAGRFFYDWADLDRVVETQTGVRLMVKGRSDAQSAYDIIPSRFGLTPRRLGAILADGIARFGPGRQFPSGRTVSPGDDLRRAKWTSLRRILTVLGVVFGGIFAMVVVWQGLDCQKILELQKNGRTTQASVTRIYTAGCGKRGCGLNVEYSFSPESTPGGQHRSYSGFAWIGSSYRPNAPDLVYARTRGLVPIVYDQTRPQMSGLNFRNQVFRSKPVAVMLEMIGVIGAIEFTVLIVILALLIPALLQKAPKTAS